ncbi:putative pyrophosphohydrolase [Pseudomonas phage vB_PpS_SYP]|nr:putative pyrophosphohydrolase [Pseudomonas phage vB_PpS_SYP]
MAEVIQNISINVESEEIKKAFEDMMKKMRGEKSAAYQTYTLEVKRWNEIMQNAPVPGDDMGTLAKIRRQSAFVVEEAKEIQDGADMCSLREVLDGHLDTRFVNDQIGVYLEALGVDLKGAWEEVCASNNSKFSNDKSMMDDSALDIWYRTGQKVEVVESPIKGTYVLKRVSDGKIMKPLCFREPNLLPFIPEGLR